MIPELILIFVLSVLPPNSDLDPVDVAALAWGIEGECTYMPGDASGPVSRKASFAVGCVILNRVARPWYPDDIAGVVTQPGQFDPALTITSVNLSSVDTAVSILSNPGRCDPRGLFVYSRDDLRRLRWSHKSREAIEPYETDAWGLYVFDRYPKDIIVDYATMELRP